MALPGIWGTEFLVNTVTEGAQLSPTIAALADGRFAITWVDWSASSAFGFTDFSNTAIRAQVFNGDGGACGAPIQVNTAQAFYQLSPKIAPLADGGFVVTYSDLSAGYGNNNDDIWADAVRLQRFSGDGVKLGHETLVNTTVYGDQDYPAIAALSNGRFVVAWDDGYADADENLRAQIFNLDGTFASGEFTVNQATAGSQTGSAVAALGSGAFVVTWTDANGADGDGARVAARLFNANGAPITGDFQVNTTAAGDQYGAQVTALARGWFVVVWTDNSRGVETGGDDTSGLAVRGQVFDAGGVPVGDEFLVNQHTANGQSQPAVLALSDGRFLVAYSDTSGGACADDDDTSLGAIRARIFRANGTPDGDAFLVNATTDWHQNEPQMVELPDGRVVFTWTDFSADVLDGGGDDSAAAIRARIFDPREAAIVWSGTKAAEHVVGTRWADTLSGERGGDHLAGNGFSDAISGGFGADTLIGGGGGDRIWGDSGADRLDGNSGRDRLFGGGGADFLDGGSGRDRIDGGAEGDVIVGGGGADILTGGAGWDVFVYADPADSGPAQDRRDTIADFAPGQDLIDLRDIDANPATADDDAFAFLRRGAFTGVPGELRYRLEGGQTRIMADLDGDRQADMEIVLDGRTPLDADDFFL